MEAKDIGKSVIKHGREIAVAATIVTAPLAGVTSIEAAASPTPTPTPTPEVSTGSEIMEASLAGMPDVLVKPKSLQISNLTQDPIHTNVTPDVRETWENEGKGEVDAKTTPVWMGPDGRTVIGTPISAKTVTVSAYGPDKTLGTLTYDTSDSNDSK